MLYFAYGSNMSRAAMAARCPGARALGPARLDGYRFFVGVDGWASLRPSAGGRVHGVLWRLTPRDLAAMHAYELLHAGLYNIRRLPVRAGTQLKTATIYLLRRRVPGRPNPGYIRPITVAARDWKMPERYIETIERWSVSCFTGARVIDAGERA